MNRLFTIMIIALLLITTGCNKHEKNNRIFNPDTVKVGDEFDGFTVTEVVLNNDGYTKVAFNGSFTLHGILVGNLIGGNPYMLVCDKEEISINLPIATWNLEEYDTKNRQFFYLLSEEKVSEAIGKERAEKILEGIPNGIEVEYKIRADLNNFVYWSKEGTDVSSSFELVELLSIEDIGN
jgi:hypothetical protein